MGAFVPDSEGRLIMRRGARERGRRASCEPERPGLGSAAAGSAPPHKEPRIRSPAITPQFGCVLVSLTPRHPSPGGRLHFEDLQVLSWLLGATGQRGWELGVEWGGGMPSLSSWKRSGPGWGKGGRVSPLGTRTLGLIFSLKLEPCSECIFLGLTQRTPRFSWCWGAL